MTGALIGLLTASLLFAASAAAKPFVVILGDARGAEAADLLTPYAILAESGAVEVKVVAATPEKIRLTPGMAWATPQMTFEALETRPPDVVIVPAMTVEDDPARSDWLRARLRHGARVMSICNGARVLAAAGLLDGREAVVHWYSRDELARKHPAVRWRGDVRWISDGPITTTAGISASEPATLQLLRELAGEELMRATASRLALPPPDQRHDGEDFRLTFAAAALTVRNRLSFWRHEAVAAPLADGVDELALGAVLDAWSRTYLSTAWAVGPATVVSRRGLLLHPSPSPPARLDREVPVPDSGPMAATFEPIGAAYGEPTARLVALQFEHPYGAASAW